jgi:clan AA aspartic protease (TIGR02281 family)
MRSAFALALFLAAAVALPARAEMYKWTDEAGKVHFTDNLFNVPQKYLEQIKTYREESAPDKGGDIPLTRSPAGYLVDVMVNGQTSARLVIDTGATATVISPGLLEKAGVKVSRDALVRVRTAGGDTMAARATVDSLTVGDLQQGPMRIIAHEVFKDVDGLLGMDFLGAYRVEILSSGPTLRLTLP